MYFIKNILLMMINLHWLTVSQGVGHIAVHV